jgi:hypothetical protein
MDDLEGFPSKSLISSMVSSICDGTRNETIWDGMKASVIPVSFAWEFARYDHPVWAFFISFVILIFSSNDN